MYSNAKQETFIYFPFFHSFSFFPSILANYLQNSNNLTEFNRNVQNVPAASFRLSVSTIFLSFIVKRVNKTSF